jgi:hypothetical protein
MLSWMRDWFQTWEAYCFKCRCDRKIENPRMVVLRNGNETRQGICFYCGTNLSTFARKA